MREIKGLVSISIPFHNSERFLAEAIESVLAQTYTNWELFLVDDGATDNSTAIAWRYAEKSGGQIRYLEHEGHHNYGVTRTRNLGAANSNGEYLAFLDSDDIWLPFKLEQQVALLEAHPEAAMVYGPSEYWYDWDQLANQGQENHIPLLAQGGRVYFPPSLLIRSHPLGAFGAPCPSSFLLRRSAFNRVGGFVEAFSPDTYQLYEDTAFLTRIYLNESVFVSASCTDRYRCHPLSIWHRIKGTEREESERRFYFRWLRQYLRQQRNSDPEVRRRVLKKAWMYWLPLPASVTMLLRRIGNRLSR